MRGLLAERGAVPGIARRLYCVGAIASRASKAMLFGTYANPARWDGRCGYDDTREQRLGEMLRWRDVHR